MHTPFLEALGYDLKLQKVELQGGMPIPVWAAYGEAFKRMRTTKHTVDETRCSVL
jgi:hypothetical protein